MSAIVLTEEQERLLGSLDSQVEVRNRWGDLVGTLIRDQGEEEEPVKVSPEVIQILAGRMAMKDIEWKTTAQVLDRLKQIDAQCGE